MSRAEMTKVLLCRVIANMITYVTAHNTLTDITGSLCNRHADSLDVAGNVFSSKSFGGTRVWETGMDRIDLMNV